MPSTLRACHLGQTTTQSRCTANRRQCYDFSMGREERAIFERVFSAYHLPDSLSTPCQQRQSSKTTDVSLCSCRCPFHIEFLAISQILDKLITVKRRNTHQRKDMTQTRDRRMRTVQPPHRTPAIASHQLHYQHASTIGPIFGVIWSARGLREIHTIPNTNRTQRFAPSHTPSSFIFSSCPCASLLPDPVHILPLFWTLRLHTFIFVRVGLSLDVS